MPQVIGFDVYGALVESVDMGKHLEEMIGDKANEFGQLWHDKKVEHAFRKSLMQQDASFSHTNLHCKLSDYTPHPSS